MAKSSSFFGLRTGSTKSLTFQVYRGQQITKDRVTRIANPRSEAQMKQRALIPIVAAARAQLKGLVDHSFEGVAYGEPSLREFSKLNLRSGALQVSSYSPNGVSNAGFASLQVSKGSIGTKFLLKEANEESTEYVAIMDGPKIAFPAVKAGDPATEVFKYLENYAKESGIEGIKPGTQLTFLSIYGADLATVGNKDVNMSGFSVARIMIPDGETNQATLNEVNGEWKIKTMGVVGASNVTIINNNQDEILISGPTEAKGDLSFKIYPNAAKNDNNGGALILSRYENGTWRRNTAKIEIAVEPGNKWTFEDWLQVYKSTGSASKKYLNNGNDPIGIRA